MIEEIGFELEEKTGRRYSKCGICDEDIGGKKVILYKKGKRNVLLECEFCFKQWPEEERSYKLQLM